VWIKLKQRVHFCLGCQIRVLPNGYFKLICIKADLDIGGTEFNVDPLLATSLYSITS